MTGMLDQSTVQLRLYWGQHPGDREEWLVRLQWRLVEPTLQRIKMEVSTRAKIGFDREVVTDAFATLYCGMLESPPLEKRVESVLQQVGAEIYDRAWRRNFIAEKNVKVPMHAKMTVLAPPGADKAPVEARWDHVRVYASRVVLPLGEAGRCKAA